MSSIEIEERLTAVEKQVSKLAKKIASSASSESQDLNGWIDQIHGTFQNDAAYRQAARLGREWRKSQRPRSRKSSK